MSDVKTTVGELPEFLTRGAEVNSQKEAGSEAGRWAQRWFKGSGWQTLRVVVQKQLPAITIAFIGFACVGYGWLALYTNEARATDQTVYKVEPKVQDTVTPSVKDKPIENAEIVVNVSGAVGESGLYKLANDARVGDAIQAAGGLHRTADAAFVQKQMNLAGLLQDGAKVYVPHLGETEIKELLLRESPIAASGNAPQAEDDPDDNARQSPVGTTQEDQFVSINQATQAELEELPGIGPARAMAIIEGRPYPSTEDLLSRKVLPESIYAQIKDLIGL